MTMRTKLTLLLVLAMALATMAFVMPWECETGTVCHALLYHDSTLFILCADGTPDLTEHGPDSWEIQCRSHVFMPMVGR